MTIDYKVFAAGIGQATSNFVDESRRKSRLAEQFTHFGTLQENSHEVPNTINQHIDSSVSQIFVGYNFADRFGVQFNLPLIYREFRRPHGAFIENGTQFGIGDSSLIGNYIVCRSLHKDYTLTWNVIGGVKFPTGSASHLKEPDVESENGLPPSAIAGHDWRLGRVRSTGFWAPTSMPAGNGCS